MSNAASPTHSSSGNAADSGHTTNPQEDIQHYLYEQSVGKLNKSNGAIPTLSSEQINKLDNWISSLSKDQLEKLVQDIKKKYGTSSTIYKNLNATWQQWTDQEPGDDLSQVQFDSQMRADAAGQLAAAFQNLPNSSKDTSIYSALNNQETTLSNLADTLNKQIGKLIQALDEAVPKVSDSLADVKEHLESLSTLLDQINPQADANGDTNASDVNHLPQSVQVELTNLKSQITSLSSGIAKLSNPSELSISQCRSHIAASLGHSAYKLGRSFKNTFLAAQRSVNSENLYQQALVLVNDLTTFIDDPKVTVDDINNQIDVLNQAIQDPTLDANMKNYLTARVHVLQTALNALESGQSVLPLGVSIIMKIGLVQVDMGRLAQLKQEALNAKDQNMADRIQNQIDALNSLSQALANALKSAFESYANTYHPSI